MKTMTWQGHRHLRIALALVWVLATHALYDPINHIESARIYGNVDKYAYYFLDLLVGSPPQRVSVIVDTGSSLSAFPCASCPHCGTHLDPAYDFAKSSTASWVGCGRSCQSKCKSGHCGYHQGYTEGSSISGYWFNDWVRIGDSLQKNPAIMGRMGCHQNENNLFYTQKANGIMGIGPKKSGTLLQELFKDVAHVNQRVFSMCLAEWGGRISVGGFNASYHRGDVKWVRMSTGSSYYGVSLTSMSVDGHVVSTSFGSTIIDSGTTYVYMGSAPYNALRGAIESYCAKNSRCGAERQKTCYTISDGVLDRFPTVTVSFGSVSTRWGPRGYLYRKGQTKKWCYAFENDGNGAGTVLGATWMQHHDVIFDLVNNNVGIADAACPEYRQRPDHHADADMTLPLGSNGTVRLGRASRLRSKEAPLGAAIFAVLLGGLCGFIVWHRCRVEGESGEPEADDGPMPELLGVGSSAKQRQQEHSEGDEAEAEVFQIGSDDEDPEHGEIFDAELDAEVVPQGRRGISLQSSRPRSPPASPPGSHKHSRSPPRPARSRSPPRSGSPSPPQARSLASPEFVGSTPSPPPEVVPPRLAPPPGDRPHVPVEVQGQGQGIELAANPQSTMLAPQAPPSGTASSVVPDEEEDEDFIYDL